MTFLLANNCQRYMVLGKLNIKGKLLNCDCKFLYNQSLGKFQKKCFSNLHNTCSWQFDSFCICLIWCYFKILTGMLWLGWIIPRAPWLSCVANLKTWQPAINNCLTMLVVAWCFSILPLLFGSCLKMESSMVGKVWYCT